MACSYDSSLSDAFTELSKLREEANRLQTRLNTNAEKNKAVAKKQQVEKREQTS